jgi:enoyl-CoA hydratase/carnithine racemase
VQVHDTWAEVTLARSEKRNALSNALVEEVFDAFAAVEEAGCVIVVLAGDGPVFCAGGDRSEIGEGPVASDRLLGFLAETDRFVVARVERPAYGAGVSLVASCPVAIAGPAARFSLPEAALGNLPIPIAYLDGICSPRRLIDRGVRGKEIDPAEALASVLVAAGAVDPAAVDQLLDEWVRVLSARPVVADQARRFWQQRLRDEVAPRDRAVRRLVLEGLA